MDIQKKEFTGVWIPREVADDYSLNAYEKILYVEIASFPVCYMLNKTLAERIGASEKTVSRYIKTLIEKGYVRVLKNDGRKRYVQAVKDFPVKSVVIQELDGILLGGQSVYSDRTNCPPSMDTLSTIDNSIDNKERVPTKIQEPEGDDIEVVAEEDLMPRSSFGRKASGRTYSKSAKVTKLSSLGKDLQDTLKDWATITDLDGNYNDKDTEEFIQIFTNSLKTRGWKPEELDPPTVVQEFKYLLNNIKDPFHRKNLTSMSYLKSNYQRILKDVDN